eukprot:6054031-Pyramimonas_sp.AAC.1
MAARTDLIVAEYREWLMSDAGGTKKPFAKATAVRYAGMVRSQLKTAIDEGRTFKLAATKVASSVNIESQVGVWGDKGQTVGALRHFK